MDYHGMLAFHSQTKAAVTVGVIRVPIHEAHRFGTVTTGDDSEILEFAEKSSHPRSNLASMGIYVFNRDILSRRLREDAMLPHSLHDFGYSIIPNILGKDKVNAYEFTGYWEDIGTPQAYYAANMELVSAEPSFSLNGTQKVLTQRLNMPPPNVSPNATVVNSLLSPGCVVKGHVENSVLSPGVWVDAKAEVRNSVLMPNVSVGYHSFVDTCILDEGVNIGRLCYIGFGESLRSRDFDLTILGKGVTVPSQTAIGHDCTVSSNVDVSRFRGSLIASGSTISQQDAVLGSNSTEKAERNGHKLIMAA